MSTAAIHKYAGVVELKFFKVTKIHIYSQIIILGEFDKISKSSYMAIKIKSVSCSEPVC